MFFGILTPASFLLKASAAMVMAVATVAAVASVVVIVAATAVHNPQSAIQNFERNAWKQTANEHLPLKHSTSRKWRTTSRVCSYHIHVGCKFYTILKFYFVIFAKLLAWRLYLFRLPVYAYTFHVFGYFYLLLYYTKRPMTKKRPADFFEVFLLHIFGDFFPFSVVVVVVDAMGFFSDGEKCYIPPKSHMRWEHVKSIGKYHGIASHSKKF